LVIEATIQSSMSLYKRNQLEEAIVRTLGANDAQARALKLKIKRLLLSDRRLGRGKRSVPGAVRYAFYTGKPQGTGTEVLFNGYEVFAVLAAVIVLQHGIPQAKVVSILREVRSDFEAAHRDTLQMDPRVLFDPQAVRKLPGLIAVDNAAPVFLAFVKLDVRKGRVHAFISVCRGFDELGKFLKEHSVPGSGATYFEFARSMHTLATNLTRTRPLKRGRSTI
jgi:hypothetical protein